MRERYASGINDDTAKKMVELLNSNLANLIDLSMIIHQKFIGNLCKNQI